MKKSFIQKFLRTINTAGSVILFVLLFYEIIRGIVLQPNQKELLENLKTEFNSITKPSDAKIVEEQYSAIVDKTHISVDYSTTLPDSEIQRFYYNQLLKSGWRFTKKEKVYDWGNDYGGFTVTYNKLNLILAMQYSGVRTIHGWDYSVFLKIK